MCISVSTYHLIVRAGVITIMSENTARIANAAGDAQSGAIDASCETAAVRRADGG